MTVQLLDDFKAWRPHAEKQTAGFRAWARDNCGAKHGGTPDNPTPDSELGRWVSFWSQIEAGTRPAVPVMATEEGQALVGVGKLYLDATLPAPTPDPEPAPTDDLFARFQQLQAAWTPERLGAAAKRIVTPDTPAAALAAINGIQAGDSVRLPAGMKIPGRVILPRVAAVAEVLCNGAQFLGVDNSQALSQGRWDTILAEHCANIRMYDGVVPQSANGGIRLYGDCPAIGFYGFEVYGCNGTGFMANPIDGNVDDCDFVGTIRDCGVQWFVDKFDPHDEKGTGLHATYLGGASGGRVRGLRYAAYTPSQAYGAAVQVNLIDSSPSRPSQIACYAKQLTFAAQSQVAANVVQAWGDNYACQFPFLYGEDCQGRVVDCNTPTIDTAYKGLVVAFARHLRTNLNPALARTEGNVPATQPYDTRRGVVYQDAA